MRRSALVASVVFFSTSVLAQTPGTKGVEEDIVRNTAATAANTEELLKRVQALEEAMVGSGTSRPPLVIPGFSGDAREFCKSLHFSDGQSFPPPALTDGTRTQLQPNPTAICFNP